MMDDQANMAQNTAYYLPYKSSINKINSEQIKEGQSPPSRQQMMPSSSTVSGVAPNRHSSNGSNMWSASISNLRPSDLRSSESNLSSLLQGKMNSTEKQKTRKAMPLSMLLQKTDSRIKRKVSNNSRSITEKQLSFQIMSRLPSQSLVNVQQTNMTPIVRRPSQPQPLV